MKNTLITVRQHQTGYSATFSGEGVAEIIELFGTATIPIAFTPAADVETVLKKVAELNPLADVVLGRNDHA